MDGNIVIFIQFIVGKRESSTILHVVISVIEIEFANIFINEDQCLVLYFFCYYNDMIVNAAGPIQIKFYYRIYTNGPAKI